MTDFLEKNISWQINDSVLELALHRAPCNEMGTAMLEELERFARALSQAEGRAGALIIYSQLPAGFSAGRGSSRTLCQRAAAHARRTRGRRAGISRAHTPRAERSRRFTSDHHCRRARRHLWRGVRAGAGLRPHHSRQTGAILLSGTSSGAYPRFWRHPSPQARPRQRHRA